MGCDGFGHVTIGFELLIIKELVSGALVWKIRMGAAISLGLNVDIPDEGRLQIKQRSFFLGP